MRTLHERPETQALALKLLTHRDDPQAAPEAVLRRADRFDEILAQEGWKRRRSAKMTMDEAVTEVGT